MPPWCLLGAGFVQGERKCGALLQGLVLRFLLQGIRIDDLGSRKMQFVISRWEHLREHNYYVPRAACSPFSAAVREKCVHQTLSDSVPASS